MKQSFVPRKFQGSALKIIEAADAIIAEYRSQGFTLTLRQLYYQFVARAIIPNKQSEYKRLGNIISNARLAGLIDWSGIEDRTRNLRTHAFWDSPANIIDACAWSYREDVWRFQTYRPEIWIEKDALVGVVEPAANRWRVPFFACRGYSSQSEQYSAGLRFQRYLSDGRIPVILHLGDHDPSGIDMTRDNQDRLSLFAGEQIEVIRLALNMDQVREYNPPPNPAKDTDARFEDYRALHGDESWELDALSPTVIDGLIENEMKRLVSQTSWDSALNIEGSNRSLLKRVSAQWDQIVEGL